MEIAVNINKEVYSKILDIIPTIPPETGGILGGKNDIITNFVFDTGLPNGDIGHYYPDIDKLNSCILDWQKHGIKFYGIVHSHLNHEKSLSLGDEVYIKEIMFAMPTDIKTLYFPIVFPRKEIIPYRAEREKDKLKIIFDGINIIF